VIARTMMRTMARSLRLAALCLLPAATAPTTTAQTVAAAPPVTAVRPVAAVIEEHVRIGLASNLALQSASLEVERAEAALDAARGRFFPEASLNARYTRSEGGREISLPLAAAFNPVYGTLNELLAADGKPPRFGSISDPSFSLLREREQDTRISVVQPLYAPALPAALRARQSLLEGSEFARLALAQRLRRDITVGYLDWLRASRAATLVDASAALLAENLRITDSLFRNGKVTQDQVLRARAELLEVEQQSTEARSARDQLRSYVNFLLNRPLDTALESAEPEGELKRAERDLAALRDGALTNRPELAQAGRAAEAARSQAEIARAARLPTLALAVDGGTQGERYEFGRGSNFATLSLLLNWTLFDGGSRKADERAARLAERQALNRRDELAQQVQLEVQTALDRLAASERSLRAAEARAEAARAAFRISGRKRDEGVISQVEFLDARTSLTAAELNLNAVRFQLLARQADLDYATGAPTP
jgi:outer membrane protein TolC